MSSFNVEFEFRRFMILSIVGLFGILVFYLIARTHEISSSDSAPPITLSEAKSAPAQEKPASDSSATGTNLIPNEKLQEKLPLRHIAPLRHLVWLFNDSDPKVNAQYKEKLTDVNLKIEIVDKNLLDVFKKIKTLKDKNKDEGLSPDEKKELNEQNSNYENFTKNKDSLMNKKETLNEQNFNYENFTKNKDSLMNKNKNG